MKKIVCTIALLCAIHFLATAQQALIGAGIKVKMDTTDQHFYPYVIGFKKGMAAEKLLKVGDKILKVDDFVTKDKMEESETLAKLRGQDSTEVQLLIQREGNPKPLMIKIMRRLSLDTDATMGSCLSGNCVNGDGKFRFANNDVLEGTFKGGAAEGQCKLMSGVGDKFEGIFAGGRRNGIGKITKKNGETWEGNFENDKANGFFHIKYADGGTFDGEYLAGQMTGKGKKVLKTGETWEVEYLNGVPNGLGKHTKGDETYEGTYVNGKRCGWGKLTKGKVFVYEGAFDKNGKRVGYGAYTFTETLIGKRTEGDFVSERFKRGTVYYEPTENKIWKYEGEVDFENRPNGLGKIYYRDGKWEDGKFVNGKLDKQANKGALPLNDTKGIKFSDKDYAAALAHVSADISARLIAEGYTQESKITSKANAFATLTGETGFVYVVAAMATAKTTIFEGTIGNKEKSPMPTQAASDDKVRLLYQIRDGNGTPMFAAASAFVKGDETEITLVVYKKRK